MFGLPAGGRQRTNQIWHRLTARVRSAAVVVRREIGIDEIGLVAGVVLLALGAREVWRPAGLIAPAVVLLWIYLPQRVSFIERRFIEKRRAE